MKRRAPVLVLVLLALCCLAQCTPSWQPNDYPNPGKDAKACGRGDVKTGMSRLCDPDSVLSAKSRNVVEGIIQDIEAGREPYALMQCGAKGQTGYKVAVALMQRMAMAPAQDPAEAAQSFAKALHDDWGVGDVQCNNGVLLLLSIDDRQVYISTGAGAVRELPNSKVQAVLARMRPALRAAEYDEAVEQAVIDIGLGLAGADMDDGSHGWFDPVLIAFVSLVSGCFGFTWWKARKQRREYSKCKQLLEKLKADQRTALHSNRYHTTSCPVCLEDFTPEGDTDHAARGGKGETSKAAVGKGAGGRGAGGEAGPSSAATDAADSAPLLRDQHAGNTGGGTEDVVRRPLTLPCGHRFCTPCISRWVDSSTTCPICRKPISSDDAQPPEAAALPSQQDQRAAGGYQDLFVPDFLFRLNMLQTRYPSYIGPSMVDDWSQDVQAGRTVTWDAARHAQLHDPSIRHSHNEMGSAGATTSFGGGSSFGGGGGGSSW